MSNPKMIAWQISPTGMVVLYPDDGGRALRWGIGILISVTVVAVMPLVLFALLVLLAILL